MKESIVRLRALEKQRFAYRYALNVVDFDAETVAPEGSADGRAEACEVLSRADFDLLVNDDTAALLRQAAQDAETEQERAEVRELQRTYDQISKIPADEYAATREATVNPPHCDPATEGWQLYGKVRDLLNPDNATLVMTGTYGAPGLVRVIEGYREQGIQIESVEFAGVSTTCRVLHNAIIVYNFFPELPMIMDAATTASYTDERTEEQLEELEAWGFIVKR